MRTPKDDRFILESKIIALIYNDNKNSVHFDYHFDPDAYLASIRLEVYTVKAQTNEVLLFHEVIGQNTLEVLQRTIQHIEYIHKNKEKYSFSVTWNHVNTPDFKHISHFFEPNKEMVLEKFYHNKKIEDYLITIKHNPES